MCRETQLGHVTVLSQADNTHKRLIAFVIVQDEVDAIFECDLGFGWAYRQAMSHARYLLREVAA